MNTNDVGADYRHSGDIPHTANYLTAPVKDALRKCSAKLVLDIGCGSGDLALSLTSSGFDCYGTEPSESGFLRSRSKIDPEKIFNIGVYDDPSAIPVDASNVVISTEVIEHLYYPRKLLSFASQKLKPGGHLIVTTPYHGYLKNLVLSVTNKWDFHHTPLWDGGHIKFWSQNTLSALMDEQGFKVIRWRGCGRLPYLWKSILMVGRKSG